MTPDDGRIQYTHCPHCDGLMPVGFACHHCIAAGRINPAKDDMQAFIIGIVLCSCMLVLVLAGVVMLA
jgi:hypothetical protein